MPLARATPLNIAVVTGADDLMLRLQLGLRGIATATALYHLRDEDQLFSMLRKTRGFESALRPDLILLDAALLPALDRLKSDNPFSAIPVLVIAEHLSHALARDAHGRHANACVYLPPDSAGMRGMAAALDAFWFKTAKLPPNPDA